MRVGRTNIRLKKKSVQVWVTASIVFIFLLSFAIHLILHYRNNSEVYLKELRNQNDLRVKQFATTKELLIKSLAAYTYNLAVDDVQFKSLLENFQNNYEDKKDLAEKLRGFVNSNRYIRSAYIYLPQEKIYLTTDIDMSYEKYDFYDGDFLEKVDGSYLKILEQREVNVLGKTCRYISILCSVMSKGGRPVGVFAANIDSDAVYKEAQKTIAVGERFHLYAIDEDGKILYSNMAEETGGRPEEVQGSPLAGYPGRVSRFSRNGLISDYYSPSEKITYRLDLELRDASNKNIIEYTLVSFLITLCLGFTLKLIMSRKVFKPLGKVMGHVKNTYPVEGDRDSEIEVIENAFSELIHKNVELKSQYMQMLPGYREKLLHDIVVRRDYTAEEIRSKLAYYEISPGPGGYIVVTLRIVKRSGAEEKNRMVKILIRNKIEEWMAEKYAGFCVETGKDDISVCLNLNKNTFDDMDYDAVVQFAEGAVSSIKEEFMLCVNAGIGSFAEDIAVLYKSYEESVETLNYNKMLGKAVGSVYEIKKFNNRLFEYPYDLEYKLLSFIKAGDYKESCGYLACIFERIQGESMLTDSEIESILFLLLGALNELLYRAGIDIPDKSGGVTKMLQMVRNHSLQEVQEEFKAYITKIIDQIHVINAGADNVIRQILKHIDENYAGELQLMDLESKFKLNRYYIGQLIKENTGINFNDYLNKRRIDRAVDLLKNSDLSIKDISEAVGYRYPHYFIKLFRKAYKVAPGEFRRQWGRECAEEG